MTDQNYKDEAKSIVKWIRGRDKHSIFPEEIAIPKIAEALQCQYTQGWNDAVEECVKVAKETCIYECSDAQCTSEQIGRLKK